MDSQQGVVFHPWANSLPFKQVTKFDMVMEATNVCRSTDGLRN
jgi:hypothetical protein